MGYIVHSSNKEILEDFKDKINKGLITDKAIEETRDRKPRIIYRLDKKRYYYSLCHNCSRHVVLTVKPYNFITIFEKKILCKDCKRRFPKWLIHM